MFDNASHRYVFLLNFIYLCSTIELALLRGGCAAASAASCQNSFSFRMHGTIGGRSESLSVCIYITFMYLY